MTRRQKLKEMGERIAIISRFLADSGATEHLTNSKVIFKKFNDSDKGVIKCAKKNKSADLNSEGSGIVEINHANNKTLELDNVICAESLSENLLSLRRFAEMGLGIYLDDEKIDIFDPISNESFITGLYKQPYWVIELEINSSNTNDSVTQGCANRCIFANLTENETGEYTHFT